MRKISNNPECFSISTKEIAKNNMILSPHYYIEKKKQNKINKWFKELPLEHKEMLKRIFEHKEMLKSYFESVKK